MCDLLKHDEPFRYQLLSRMASDCEYYLGNGNRNAKYLWGTNEEEHIKSMKILWNSFSKEKKPEWLTWEQVEKYEKEMLNNEKAKKIKHSKQQVISIVDTILKNAEIDKVEFGTSSTAGYRPIIKDGYHWWEDEYDDKLILTYVSYLDLKKRNGNRNIKEAIEKNGFKVYFTSGIEFIGVSIMLDN